MPQNMQFTEMKWNEKCNDLKCVQKPTQSRLSLTHHANKSSRWADKNIKWSESPWNQSSRKGKRNIFIENHSSHLFLSIDKFANFLFLQCQQTLITLLEWERLDFCVSCICWQEWNANKWHSLLVCVSFSFHLQLPHYNHHHTFAPYCNTCK